MAAPLSKRARHSGPGAAVLIALALLLGGPHALAQNWPAKTVRIIVPFAPGGTADTLGRLVAQRLAESFKENFVVENRAGAGGVIGSELVAKAAPDAYMLVVSGVATHCIAPALSKNFPFDPLRDFTHIALFGGPPGVLVVNPALPTQDLAQFIAYARKEPGKLAYGSPGNGTQGHLIAEQLKQIAGIEMTHVPYKGASLAVADLIAGHVPVTSTTLTTAATQIKAGRARALAVSSAKRVPEFPEVPTFGELGYPELTASIWFSLSGPAGIAPEIVSRLNTEVRRALQASDVRERLRPEGIEPGDLDPRQFAAFVAAELKRWAPIVRASGATAD
ncbi:MAG: tripartite tricarboxylate transporter substrate binding protein [Betaproteobacteria bacterium]|nr:MAG: tripartite tricarboxylate transporter substrate binding protein [Betaproteobacteria bacterium]